MNQSNLLPQSELNKVISESRNEIHSANEQVLAKKRGRPSGTVKGKSIAPPLSLSSPNNPTATSQAMSVDGYKAMLGGIINLLGMYLNKSSETECFTLTKEEMELITSQGAECMIEFVPTVDSKYLKLAGFSLVVVSVYGMRYNNFVSIQNEKKKVFKAKSENEV